MSAKIALKILTLFVILVIFVTGCVGMAEEVPIIETSDKLEFSVEESEVTATENYKLPKATITPQPISTQIVIETKRVETPEPVQTEYSNSANLPILPTLKVEENGEIKVFFGDFYRELPLSKNSNVKVIPDSIVIHTDGQSGNYPEKWNTMSTYWGLGDTKSVHFAVSQDGISQMLPMGETQIERCNGTLEQWNDNGDWVDYDGHSIQIEMGGRDFDYIMTGQASPKMVEVVEVTTGKTIDLVVSLMIFYDIPFENIVGHYQIGRGKIDPGYMYFEQYFLPLLEKRFKEFESISFFSEGRRRVYELMKSYGYIEDYQLSEEYWKKMDERIVKYGRAERILTLEFHGDEYDMFDGFYSMNQESFKKQIKYLMENDYHFSTIHEVKGFVEGWLDLPKRSVILTSDPGPLAWESTERIIIAFSELEAEYGYKPHINTFIVPQGLSEEENYLCKGNSCWLSYVHAIENGYFSLGTHTYWHNHHDQVSEISAKQDIKMSQDLIAENTGVTVYAISWPYEICSPYKDMLVAELGITLGFGGLSDGGKENYTYNSDPRILCLPRLFPENPSGFSGRPGGKTLVEMLKEAEK